MRIRFELRFLRGTTHINAPRGTLAMEFCHAATANVLDVRNSYGYVRHDRRRASLYRMCCNGRDTHRWARGHLESRRGVGGFWVVAARRIFPVFGNIYRVVLPQSAMALTLMAGVPAEERENSHQLFCRGAKQWITYRIMLDHQLESERRSRVNNKRALQIY